MTLKDSIEQKRQELAEVTNELRELVAQCPHSEIEEENEAAFCQTCGRFYGWYCEPSPDHTCHYYTTDGQNVRLVSGESVPAPAGHREEDETEDSCIFCHQPEERK